MAQITEVKPGQWARWPSRKHGAGRWHVIAEVALVEATDMRTGKTQRIPAVVLACADIRPLPNEVVSARPKGGGNVHTDCLTLDALRESYTNLSEADQPEKVLVPVGASKAASN